MKKFFAELEWRNVYKVAVAYGVAGWALTQGVAQVCPVFDVPNWAIRLIVVLIIIGFPIALVLAWAFELTPEGLKRTEDVGLASLTARWLDPMFDPLGGDPRFQKLCEEKPK